MRPIVTGALAAAVILGCAAPAMAQGTSGQTHGTVFDSDRKGVAGLSVALISETGPHILGSTTDESGRYAFRKLPGGMYSVVLRDPGVGIARKDGIRVRPVFRSIIDFNVPADFGDDSLPSPVPDASSETGNDPAGSIALSCSVVDLDEDPVPDASVTITPVEAPGSLGRDRTDQAGRCLVSVTPGTYRIAVTAPGFMTWSMAPVVLDGSGSLNLSLVLVRFPMGFEGTIEDLLIPQDPIPPEDPEEGEPADGDGTGDGS